MSDHATQPLGDGDAAGTAFPDHPWAVLPRRLARELGPVVPGLADLLVREISTHVPQYRGRRSDRFWEAIQLGVQQSLHEFLGLLGEQRGPTQQTRATVRGLGRNEYEAGRTLDALQMAYRIGARHAWRAYAAATADLELSTEHMTAFAEAIFAFVDELAAESVAGYAEAQAAAASEYERRRALLVDALTAPVQDAALVRQTATAAGWVLPERVQVAVATSGALHALSRDLGADALTAVGDGEELIVVWGDPEGPGREGRLTRALDRLVRPAALGPVVPLAVAARSLRGARDALALGLRGAIGAGPWRWEDHLAAIALAQAEEPLAALGARLLAPLGEESPGSAERLRQTLEAVLEAGGNHGTAAHQLGVHVQTVRYRLGRLRELLGPTLDDPARRFELQLALRARRLASAARAPLSGD